MRHALAEFLAESCLSYRTVERPSFRRLIQLCNPLAPALLVKEDTIANYMSNLYRTTKNKLIQKFQEANSKINITCDIWTSPNGISILGITVHWIDSEWILREALISAAQLKGLHTGENIAHNLYQVLSEYQIVEKLFCITTDNASNNHTMARDLSQKIPRFNGTEHLIGCFGHILNLAAKDGLKAFSYNDVRTDVHPTDAMNLINIINDEAVTPPGSIISRIHKVATHSRLTPNRRSKFEGLVKATMMAANPTYNGPDRLLLDTPTRWNSTCDMLARSLKLKRAFNMYVQDEQKLRGNCSIDEDEWQTMKNVIELLEPLKMATNLASTTSEISISLALPLFEALSSDLDTIIGTVDLRALDPAAIAIKEKIMKYYDTALMKSVYVCAMVLDPRYKLSAFSTDDRNYHNLIEIFKNTAAEYDHHTIDYQNINIERTTRSNRMDRTSNLFKKKKISDLPSEIDSYLREDREDDGLNPLDFWKMKKSKYPSLAAMAKVYLGVPASSTPSERAFSVGKRIVEDTRGSLKSHTINELMCLHNWQKNGIHLL